MSLNSDGKFKIKQSENITLGIKRELGLSDEDCQRIGNVWSQVLDEAEQEGNVKTNNGICPNKSNDYIALTDTVIEFSKDCWNRIVNIITSALGRKNNETNNIDASQPEINDFTLDMYNFPANIQTECVNEFYEWYTEWKAQNGHQMKFSEALQILKQPDLDSTVRYFLETAFGICDGNISENRQGRKGSCHLLSCRIALEKNPKYANIVKSLVKQNDNGTITVTFNGITDSDGNPKQIILTNEEVSKSFFSFNSTAGGSSDPDMAALELAFQIAVKELQNEYNNLAVQKEKSGANIQAKIQAEMLNNLISSLQGKRDEDSLKLLKYFDENPDIKLYEIFNIAPNDIQELVMNNLKSLPDDHPLILEQEEIAIKICDIITRYGTVIASYDENDLGKSLGNYPKNTFYYLTGLEGISVDVEGIPENWDKLDNYFSEILPQLWMDSYDKFIQNNDIDNMAIVVSFKEDNKDLNLLKDHTYVLKRKFTDEKTDEEKVTLINPHGYEVTVSYKDFLKECNNITYLP